MTFVDAGFGYNNPCEELIREAQRVFRGRAELLVLSIGTGLGDVVDIGDGRLEIIDALKKIATSSKKVAERLKNRFGESGQYFRFNVELGLKDITLSDWKRTSHIAAHTANYLSENTRKVKKFVRAFTGDARSPSINSSGTTRDRTRLQRVRETESDAAYREGIHNADRNAVSSAHSSLHPVDSFSSETPPVPSPPGGRFLDGPPPARREGPHNPRRLQVLEVPLDEVYQPAYSPNDSRGTWLQLNNHGCGTCGTEMHPTNECPWYGKPELRCDNCEFHQLSSLSISSDSS
jgi:hypothetical protein